ncbi:ECF transporter S component [Allobaculum stercoricanis]|uniref:ECF transporter S component n=1 Tax=Allobaculum stercoricanis TaxID=174709 RepID=UPI0023F3C87F|nr:ECF transporter S component [Allobaculum stercoricanis]
MKRNQKTKTIALFSMFLAIELLLVLTPLGYIRTPFLSITVMHIPVIAAGILMGPSYGAALGLVFGLTSVWNATMSPTITSFCFSPFVTIGGVSGNWTSLIIAIVPRVLLGWIAGTLFNAFNKKLNRPLSALVSGVLATLCHTIMVLGLIALLWGPQYAQAIGKSPDTLLMYLALVVLTNGIFEMIAAGIVSMALAKAIKPSMVSNQGSTNS